MNTNMHWQTNKRKQTKAMNTLQLIRPADHRIVLFTVEHAAILIIFYQQVSYSKINILISFNKTCSIDILMFLLKENILRKKMLESLYCCLYFFVIFLSWTFGDCSSCKLEWMHQVQIGACRCSEAPMHCAKLFSRFLQFYLNYFVEDHRWLKYFNSINCY